MSRKPVSIIKNRWHDAQRVDKQDMDVEQERNIQTDASIIANHFGSGILLETLEQPILFDSDNLTAEQASILASGNFDGTGISPHNQPSDNNLGNILEIELSDSDVFGRIGVKVLVIGVDFQNNPQYERFVFFKNEKQVSKKHFARILALFFVDFKGNNHCSRNIGGRIVIREAISYQISRDPIMVAQDVEPNLFFRDFKLPDPLINLQTTIQNGIGPEFTVDALNINTTVKQNRFLDINDTTTRFGQKFLATTNNIQKITLLLGVTRDETVPIENRFDWAGDLVVSIHELQTSISCPTDIVPELAIDFDPNPVALMQLSISQSELRNSGIILNDVLQPVDFVFSNTRLSSTTNPIIAPGRFYIITISRSGAANQGRIFTGVGNSRVDNSRFAVFNGSWVDVEEEDMWFQVWTDAAKLADGQAYDEGNGIEIAKTITDPSTGAEIDHVLDAQSFANSGQNIVNTAVVQAIVQESIEEQDERTGNTVNSRKKFEPTFSFVTDDGLAALKNVSDPLILGCAQDTNPRHSSVIEDTQPFIGLGKDDVFRVINPNPDILSFNLIGSKLIPNEGFAIDYRIFKVLICSDGYGDVNGDGVIDSADISRAAELLGESLLLESTQQKIVDGEIDTLELIRADVDGDGYITANDVDLITEFVNRTINSFPVGSSFTHAELFVKASIGRHDGYFDCDGYVRKDGHINSNIVHPDDLTIDELLFDGYSVDPQIDSDPAFTTVPFGPITFEIHPQAFWQDYLLSFNSNARIVPSIFSFDESVVHEDCEPPTLFECENVVEREPVCVPGRNDFMVPDNLIIKTGEILRNDGTFYPIDFEVGQVVFKVPTEDGYNIVVNIFDRFVRDVGDGFTLAGFPAMRYADCSTVKIGDLELNRIRFDIKLQNHGIVVDNIDDSVLNVHMDQSNGILTINTMNTSILNISDDYRVQVTVYLKKGGWKNTPLIEDNFTIQTLEDKSGIFRAIAKEQDIITDGTIRWEDEQQTGGFSFSPVFTGDLGILVPSPGTYSIHSSISGEASVWSGPGGIDDLIVIINIVTINLDTSQSRHVAVNSSPVGIVDSSGFAATSASGKISIPNHENEIIAVLIFVQNSGTTGKIEVDKLKSNISIHKIGGVLS